MRARWMSLVLGVATAGCSLAEGEDVDAAASALAPPVYVALGDSYASGVGTRTYYDAGCQRSYAAYPFEVADERGYELVHAACSGARVPDVRARQLGALSPSTGLVTLSVGGNDAGFASVIGECAKPWPFSCSGKIDAARSFIAGTLPGLLDGLYAEVRRRAPNARVLVVGYPRIFNGETCNLFARISASEQSKLNATADLLATTIAAAAARHGFGFVDPRSAFVGHAICDDAEWINGLSNPVGESYHPNVAGNRAYAALVDAQL